MNSELSLNTVNETPSSAKIIIGLSGGVDSAVSALFLQQQGWDVEALFMKNWDEDDDEHCAAAEDLAQAQHIAELLSIPLHTINFSPEYWESVFTYFLKEYRAGHTPNPDIICNKEIKFKAFITHARTLGASRIATGHYADIQYEADSYRLLQAADHDKDQTYFLYALNQKQLSSSLFPLANIHKSEVRKIAKQHNFPCHDRKDSTGICFIGERNFRQFLESYIPAKDGDILDLEGKLVGHHKGCWHTTIGQRHGLGIGGIRGRNDGAWYVVAKDASKNTLTVVQDKNHPLLFQSEVHISQVNWINKAAQDGAHLGCRIRHRQTMQKCRIHYGGDKSSLTIYFDQPQRAVAAGQSAVLYRNRECLGGGVIDTPRNY
ncbi:MAG: tRNA 2-thiouridine(34) synthase MnmA [Chromatiales bacterium]|nr:tRNA 2-thiouridine(34) synthase MnmA [Chromatiales bacterium]